MKPWARKWPVAEGIDELVAWQEGLVLDLTQGAFYIALRHGIHGSLRELELELYRAFQPVIRGVSRRTRGAS